MEVTNWLGLAVLLNIVFSVSACIFLCSWCNSLTNYILIQRDLRTRDCEERDAMIRAACHEITGSDRIGNEIAPKVVR